MGQPTLTMILRSIMLIYQLLFENWGETTTIGKADGDLNLDGVVDVDDYAIMTNWWGRGVSDFAAQAPLGPIPEPSTGLLSLCCGATTYVLGTRRWIKYRQRAVARDF